MKGGACVYYEWNEAMKTGHPLIDEQHHKLVEHLEAILKNAALGRDPVRLEKELQFFERYIIEHFTDEEALHQESGAPGFEAHLAAHVTLIEMTESLLSSIKMDGFSLITELKFYNGLVKHFIEQVHQYDVPLASFMKGKR